MRLFGVLLLVVALGVGVGCKRDSSKIQGTWSKTNGGLVWEFGPDGGMKEIMLLDDAKGSYRISDGRLIVHVDYLLATTTYDFKYEFVGKDTLRLSDGRGTVSRGLGTFDMTRR